MILNMNFRSLKKILEKEIVVKGLCLARVEDIVFLLGVLFSALCSQEMILWIFVALLLLFKVMRIIRKLKDLVTTIDPEQKPRDFFIF